MDANLAVYLVPLVICLFASWVTQVTCKDCEGGATALGVGGIIPVLNMVLSVVLIIFVCVMMIYGVITLPKQIRIAWGWIRRK
jgi:hypothetical protein